MANGNESGIKVKRTNGNKQFWVKKCVGGMMMASCLPSLLTPLYVLVKVWGTFKRHSGILFWSPYFAPWLLEHLGAAAAHSGVIGGLLFPSITFDTPQLWTFSNQRIPRTNLSPYQWSPMNISSVWSLPHQTSINRWIRFLIYFFFIQYLFNSFPDKNVLFEI